MLTIRTTIHFDHWLAGLRDEAARQRINIRIRRVSLGNFGDIKPVGEGVSELRIDHGPGYRVYLIQRGDIILLCGGDKASQPADITLAKRLAREDFK